MRDKGNRYDCVCPASKYQAQSNNSIIAFKSIIGIGKAG